MELPDDVIADVRKRLHRVSGQLAGIERMLDDGRECKDVVTQISAATKALEQTGFKLVAAGLTYCLANPEEAEASGYPLETIEKIKSRPNPNLQLLGVLITLHDKRTTLGKDIQKQIDQVFKGKLFKTTISKSIRLEESPAYRESIFTFAPRSSGALEYYSLTEEILSRV